MDETPKSRTHLNLFGYQHEFLDENGYNISKVVREAVDDWLVEEGQDPEALRETYVPPHEDGDEDEGVEAGPV